MSEGNQDHGGVPVTIAVVAYGLDQAFDLLLGQVLPRPQLLILQARRRRKRLRRPACACPEQAPIGRPVMVALWLNAGLGSPPTGLLEQLGARVGNEAVAVGHCHPWQRPGIENGRFIDDATLRQDIGADRIDIV